MSIQSSVLFKLSSLLWTLLFMVVGVCIASAQFNKVPDMAGIELRSAHDEAQSKILAQDSNFKTQSLTRDGKEVCFDAQRQVSTAEIFGASGRKMIETV